MVHQLSAPLSAPPGAAALDEGCDWGARVLQGCAVETNRYVERMARDGRAAFARLQDCRDPVELLAAQQAWLLARGEALAESSWRLWAVALGAAPAAAHPDVFRLPD